MISIFNRKHMKSSVQNLSMPEQLRKLRTVKYCWLVLEAQQSGQERTQPREAILLAY